MPRGRKRATAATVAVPDAPPLTESEVKKSRIEKALNAGDCDAALDEIEPDAEFTKTDCHVYVEDGVIWDATLNQTNIGNNNNKFYILQILKEKNSDTFHLWFRWGRVGFSGQKSHEILPLAAAQATFKRKFKDKTGNDFLEKENVAKKSGKYDLVMIDYKKKTKPQFVEKDGIKEDASVPSQLEARVKELIDRICNQKTMKAYLERMNYDTNRAPLGSLTKAQIKAGYAILSEIEKRLVRGKFGKDYDELVNSYYTKIPHYFGMKRPPKIENLDEFKNELELLEALSDVEVAISAMKEEPDVRVLNPSDRNYERLKCEIVPLEKKDTAYKTIETYLKNTHGETHGDYRMKLVNVFVVSRQGEEENFRKDLHNHMLLWHGSPIFNWFGILYKGLRIAPPEAPSTGYMFGKGVYFADASSKSANYCRAHIGDRGILTLAQVALGDWQDRTDYDYEASKLPAGVHSTRGVGGREPAKRGSKKMKIDGQEVAVPCGKLTTKKDADDLGLLYNEYIVYNTNQVRLRYLVEVEFVEP